MKGVGSDCECLLSGKVEWSFIGIVGGSFVAAKLCNKWTILVPALASVILVRTGRFNLARLW